MAAVPGEAVGVASGPYFTKYSEDHWTTAETPPQSAVMFKVSLQSDLMSFFIKKKIYRL